MSSRAGGTPHPTRTSRVVAEYGASGLIELDLMQALSAVVPAGDIPEPAAVADSSERGRLRRIYG